MKRTLVKIFAGYILFNLLLAAVFISAGGWQMLKKPKIPPTASEPTLQSDLAFFHDIVLANEKDITPEQAARFSSIIDTAPTPTSEDELTLTALRALAVFDNAHTTVLTTRMYRLPLRFHWTADGLIVVKSRPEYPHLLGQRVLSLGGKAPEAMLEDTAKLTGGGTPGWQRYRSQFLFSAPSALAFLGAEAELQSTEIRTVDTQGNEASIELAADENTMPGDPFWDFRNIFPDDEHFNTEGWVSLLHRDQELPLYLQETEKLHILRKVPGRDAVYVRMNASFADKSESLDQFEQRITNLVDAEQPNNIIVDFRYNRGGDYTKVLPIVRTLSDAVPPEGRLYLLVGPNTFSAGIIAASQFKRFLPDRLTVVGSEVGDELRFRAEGFYPTLPNSGIQLYLTKAWTDLADGCGWFDDCWPPNKLFLEEIGSFGVDLPVENTWDAYLNREDLVMQAALDDIP
ncbi:hypothetical protein [Microbulbifer mangrovi]|uniref:hypothetical protein n=1 Tax=Microbulbifer mangrovi TaxID=927787 RepID=UPI00099037D9|nr:hypothetical protein [Microbulbifer mangrovi]